MLNCESCELLIADALYDPLPQAQAAQLHQHLQKCQDCAQLMESLQRDKNALELEGVGSRNYEDIPERAELDDLWDNLQQNLDRVDAEKYRQLSVRSSSPYLKGALAMAASITLIVAVFAFTRSDNGAPVELATAPANLISPELMNYLTRAETMLLLVANAEADNVSVIPLRQSFARNMALEASLMTTSMEDRFSSGQSRLLKDIEFLLLQVANLDESNMEDGVQLLQEYLEENSVLLKIRLLEMRRQAQETSATSVDEVII